MKTCAKFAALLIITTFCASALASEINESNNPHNYPEVQLTITNDSWEASIDNTIWRIENEKDREPENAQIVTLNRSDLLLGGLLLVNRGNPIPDDFSDDMLVRVGFESRNTIEVMDDEVRLFPQALQALANMLLAARDQGLNYYLVDEGYRSNEKQAKLFSNMRDRLSAEYSGDELEEKTLERVNLPGTSEYQTGMAFRIRLYSETDESIALTRFHEADQGKWFYENCWRYGIVFRFPTKGFPVQQQEDKSNLTGVSTEINLYRYVGEAHATAMRIMDFCLEEYVAFLTEHPHLNIYQDGALKYEIYRVEMSDSQAYENLPVPRSAQGYIASLDNIGGVVLAYSY